MFYKPSKSKGWTYVQCTTPTSPEEADTWLNHCTSLAYIYNGSEWVKLLENVLGQFGYIAGGVNGAVYEKTIDSIRFPFDSGVAVSIGSCSNNNLYLATPCNSTQHGYLLGGQSEASRTTTINRFDFTYSVNATQIGNLSSSCNIGGGSNSSKHGFMFGGSLSSAAATSLINKILFPFDSGTATSVNTLSNARETNKGSLNNSLYGYCFAGTTTGAGTTLLSTISRITFPFASGSATDVGLGASSRRQHCCINSSTEGYALGGYNGTPALISSIEKITFPFDSGNASLLSAYCNDASMSTSFNSTTHGYRVGITTTVGLSTIGRFSFNIAANETYVGNLTRTRLGGSGLDSNDFVNMFI